MNNRYWDSFDANKVDSDINNTANGITSKIVSGLSDLTNDEIIFLIELVDNGFKEFIIYPDNNELIDIALETALKLLSENAIFSVIKSLESKQYLQRIELEPSLQCPNCFSSKLEVNFSCPECSSTHLKKLEIIEHFYCGYKNEKKAFMTNGNLVCPKCKTDLKGIERLDEPKGEVVSEDNLNTYRVVKAQYECNICNNTFNEPVIDFQCGNCGSRYNYIDAIYQIPINYVIPDPIFRKILSRNIVNLLIVEDFTPQADVVAMLISSAGNQIEYKIAIADNGSSAILALEENEFHIIILDLGLPDTDGLKLLKKIKHNWPDTKIIVLTGYDDLEIAVEAMKNGASEFLVKKIETIQNLPYILEKLIPDNMKYTGGA